MKTIEELILAQKSPTEPPPRKKWEPHYINLKMNYNGGRRGRKTEEERKEIIGPTGLASRMTSDLTKKVIAQVKIKNGLKKP